jgi:hypothetical protein
MGWHCVVAVRCAKDACLSGPETNKRGRRTVQGLSSQSSRATLPFKDARKSKQATKYFIIASGRTPLSSSAATSNIFIISSRAESVLILQLNISKANCMYCTYRCVPAASSPINMPFSLSTTA